MTNVHRGLSPGIVLAYSNGATSWREIRETTGVNDFETMLEALGEAGLSLPRANARRPSRAKHWMEEILASGSKT